MSRIGPLRQRWKQGSIVQIDLQDGTYGFGLVLDPNIAFYDYFVKEKDLPAKLDQIEKSKFAFRISVYKNCVTQRWPIIAKIDYDPKLNSPLEKWSGGENGIYTIWKPTREKVKATWEECKDLERISVWEYGAAEQRLRDYFAGRPCWTLEKNKPDWKFIPIKKFYAQYGYDFTFLDDDSTAP